MKSRVSKITIGRLYNLGSYEHERFEIQIEVPEGASAAEAIIGVERILAGLNPKCPVEEYAYDCARRRTAWSDEEWKRSDREDWEKLKADNLKAFDEMTAKLKTWREQQAKVRALLDDLGAASQYKDAKLDWDDDL